MAGDARPGAPAERIRRMALAPPCCAGADRVRAACRPFRRGGRVSRRMGGNARADCARDAAARRRERLPRQREGRDRPPDRRQRARAVRLVRSGRGAPAAVRASAAQLHRRPRHRDVVVAQAPDGHRRGERPRRAEARDPAPGLRHRPRNARVRRAADRRQPAAAPLHDRGRRRHGAAARDRPRVARLQPPGRGDGGRAARPCDRLGAEAAARRHRHRAVAEPEPAPAPARFGEHARHARARPRSRHRRRGTDDAASGTARRCLGVHHRNLEPPARADARRRTRRSRARRVQARGLPAAAPAARHRACPRATPCRWRTGARRSC